MSLADDVKAKRGKDEGEKARRQSERETRKAGAMKPGVAIDGDKATVTLSEGADLGDIRALLASRGLDPARWIVESVRVNEWEALAYGGGPDGEPRIVTLHQLRAVARDLEATVLPAPEVEKRHRPRKRQAPKKRARLVAVVSDIHAPYHDEGLHAAFLSWLADVKPDAAVVAGDTLDLPGLSRFLPRKRWAASVKECVRAGFRVLSDYRDAHPGAEWTLLKGNHDWRLEKKLLDREPDLVDVTPGDEPDDAPHMYSIRRLLHLDRLGISLVGDEQESWDRAEHLIAPEVAIRHVAPSLEDLPRIGRSIVAGDSHRQSIRYATAYRADGTPVLRTVVEAGGMARMREGLGYVNDPKWQPGFAVVAIQPDGSTSFELAPWRDGVLTWRGERYR